MNRAMGMQVNHHGLYVGGAQPVEAGAGNDGRGGGMLEGGGGGRGGRNNAEQQQQQ